MGSVGSQNLCRTPFLPRDIRSLKNGGPAGGGFERIRVGLQIVGGIHQNSPCFRLSDRISIQVAISNGTLNRGLPEEEPRGRRCHVNLAVGIVFFNLVRQRVVLFDGALGTMLIARGLSSGNRLRSGTWRNRRW